MELDDGISKFNYNLRRGKTLEIDMRYEYEDPDDLDEEGNPTRKPLDLSGSILQLVIQWKTGRYEAFSNVPDSGVVLTDTDRLYAKVMPDITETMSLGRANYEIIRIVGDDKKALSYGEIDVIEWVVA